MIRSQVLICGGTGCTSSGSAALITAFEDELQKNGLTEEVKIVKTGCFGLCALGPVVIIYPDGTFYSRVQKDDVAEIVSEHLLKGRIVDRLVYNEVGEEVKEEVKAVALSDTVFYKSQKRVALRNCGVIDPENIDEYIAFDGYQALSDRAQARRRHPDRQGFRPARPRRRRFPDGPQVELHRGEPGRPEVRRLQRRRRRPGRVHGSFRAGRRPALHYRSHDHLRLRNGRDRRLRLRPRGVSDRGQASGAGDFAG